MRQELWLRGRLSCLGAQAGQAEARTRTGSLGIRRAQRRAAVQRTTVGSAFFGCLISCKSGLAEPLEFKAQFITVPVPMHHQMPSRRFAIPVRP